MNSGGKGAIVNIGSIASRSSSYFGGAHYTVSKARLLDLMRHPAREMRPHGIRINAISRGAVLTRMLQKGTGGKVSKEFIAKIALGYISEPEEQASVIVFLLSDESSCIAGATIDSNGGLLMVEWL